MGQMLSSMDKHIVNFSRKMENHKKEPNENIRNEKYDFRNEEFISWALTADWTQSANPSRMKTSLNFSTS